MEKREYGLKCANISEFTHYTAQQIFGYIQDTDNILTSGDPHYMEALNYLRCDTIIGHRIG